MQELVIFAGGMGTRLRDTEKLPKPFVDINGYSLISRIILAFNQTGIFSVFHILTCCDNNNYSSILSKEINQINIQIYNEPCRTGRAGALRYFLEKNSSIQKFFVSNGDTLFSNIETSELLEGINLQNNDLPITFLAKPDPTRKDYLEIEHKVSKKNKNLQNSGLFYVSREWLNSFVFTSRELKDIDHYLFSLTPKAISFPLSSCLYDAGTPERLRQIRNLIL